MEEHLEAYVSYNKLGPWSWIGFMNPIVTRSKLRDVFIQHNLKAIR